jgi:hypothetical protein
MIPLRTDERQKMYEAVVALTMPMVCNILLRNGDILHRNVSCAIISSTTKSEWDAVTEKYVDDTTSVVSLPVAVNIPLRDGVIIDVQGMQLTVLSVDRPVTGQNSQQVHCSLYRRDTSETERDFIPYELITDGLYPITSGGIRISIT